MATTGSERDGRAPSGVESLETRTLMSAAGGLEAQAGIVIDAPGTVQNAAPLGVFAGPRVRGASQRVGPADTADCFKFRVTRPLLVTITLGGFTRDIDLDLLRMNGDEIGFSYTGHPRELVTRVLQPGWYAVKVTPYEPDDGATSYTLRVRAQNLPAAPGKAIGVATPLPPFHRPGFHEAANHAGTSDDHWYKFRVTKRLKAYIDLDSLTADLDLSLHRMNGQRLALSERTGAQSEAIVRELTPGWYAIRINPFNANRSTYALRIETEAPPVPTGVPFPGVEPRLARAEVRSGDAQRGEVVDDVLGECELPAVLTLG